MLAADVLAFARAALPAPPAKVLEIGAGDGALAAALRDAGHEVQAIDPAAEPDSQVEPIPLLEAEGDFDAALAVVSLHHVEPWAESCAHLAGLLRPGARLVIDEFDVERFDERAATWWLSQRAALGFDDEHDVAEMVAELRGHIHPITAMRRTLGEWFELGEPVPGSYLHRWGLEPGLRDPEEQLIGAGRLPATGVRMVGLRRA